MAYYIHLMRSFKNNPYDYPRVCDSLSDYCKWRYVYHSEKSNNDDSLFDLYHMYRANVYYKRCYQWQDERDEYVRLFGENNE